MSAPTVKRLPHAVLAVALLLLGTVQASICQQAGRQCDRFNPCCGNGGYCFNSPWACLQTEGCDQNASFPLAGCVPPPRCRSFREDFNNPSALVNKTDYSGYPDAAHFWIENPGTDHAYVSNGSLVIEMRWSDQQLSGHGATVPTTRWLQYGVISASLKIANMQGTVSSFITKTSLSDTYGDEIDFEMLGAVPNQVQTNFYWNGQLDYTHGLFYNIPGSTVDDFHNYTVDWKPNYIRWYVDGQLLRELLPGDVDQKFPRMAGRIFFSVWDTCGANSGTVQWADGPTPWCRNPSLRNQVATMYVDWVEVKCYTEDTTPESAYVPYIYSPTNDIFGPILPSGNGQMNGTVSLPTAAEATVGPGVFIIQRANASSYGIAPVSGAGRAVPPLYLILMSISLALLL
ncbi:putative glycosidase CRH2 [Sorochytrium milnesiophthora]